MLHREHVSPGTARPAATSQVAAVSFLLAGVSSMFFSFFFAGIIDAGPLMWEIVHWGLGCGCVLAALVTWLALDFRRPMAVAVLLAAAIGPSIFVAFGAA